MFCVKCFVGERPGTKMGDEDGEEGDKMDKTMAEIEERLEARG